MIDLRSDTKTLPSEAMRRAMADADVGDDVAGEDPTVNQLQRRSAELLGKEAALLVASGTMGNLTAFWSHTEPGDEVICHHLAHMYHYERGGISAVCGCLVRPVTGARGKMDIDAYTDTIHPGDLHTAATRLVGLENSHNLSGGVALSAGYTAGVAAIARDNGAKLHIDGARFFNAAVAQGVSAASLAEPADSITFCLSKSLGAPIGAVLCGSKEFIEQARVARKILGGGMRQAGIIAAGGLVALDNIDRLEADHRRARQIAETLDGLDGITLDLDSVQTNMVYFRIDRDDCDAHGLCEQLGEFDIRAKARDEHNIRFVTHLDMDDDDIEVVCGALEDVLG
ncbi:MAG: GntG family PLP-dependent aldolase [Armatimonadota bacterium]